LSWLRGSSLPHPGETFSVAADFIGGLKSSVTATRRRQSKWRKLHFLLFVPAFQVTGGGGVRSYVLVNRFKETFFIRRQPSPETLSRRR